MPIVLPEIQKQLPKNERAAIDDFVSQLKKLLGDNLVMVVLYGSKARGDWRKESDIDMFVVIEKKTRAHQQLIRSVAQKLIQKFTTSHISTIIYSYDEYLDETHPPTMLLYFITHEGQILYESKRKRYQLDRDF